MGSPSPDLSPLDFFLWAFLKDCVYVSNPGSTQELKDAISDEIHRLPSHMVDEASTHRLPAVARRKGAHIEQLL